MNELPRCRVASWTDVGRWADVLAEEVRGADRIPETIVALTRGGWVPARLLADRLGVRRLLAVRAQHWGATATPSGRAELTEGLTGAVTGETVLVVDDITDTGESLDLAARHVEGQRPKRLETAACLHVTHAKVRPTYVAEEIPRERWVWVVFPWNYWEDIRTLVARAAGDGRDPRAVARQLKEQSSLSLPESLVRRLLRDANPGAAPPGRTAAGTRR